MKLTFVALLCVAAALPAAGGLAVRQHEPGSGKASNEAGAYSNPEVWGPAAWFLLHSITLALPEQVPPEQQNALKGIMQGLQHVLPCKSCGRHLAGNMEKMPIEPHLATRDGMIQWMIDLHNIVSNSCDKRSWTREEVVAKYNEAFAAGVRPPEAREAASFALAGGNATQGPVVPGTQH